MQLINLTLPQLRAATKAQIITAITNRLNNITKREIIIWLLENMDRIADAPVITRRQDGQIDTQTETTRDIETGEIVETRTVSCTYYDNGDIDTITITNGADLKRVKHYLDGRQPEVI